jgi:hypothetical protein
MCPGTDCPWANETVVSTSFRASSRCLMHAPVDKATDALTTCARQAIAHAEKVAGVLAELNADVVNLCEVEGCDELDYLKVGGRATWPCPGRRTSEDPGEPFPAGACRLDGLVCVVSV